MKLSVISESKYYTGGSGKPGRYVTYYTTSPTMAQSYADMYNDRFGDGGAVHEKHVVINNPAPEELINQLAARYGIEDNGYTPASVFDNNLNGDGPVAKLVGALKGRGYDGAILMDIAYGRQEEGLAHIVFS